MLMVIQIKLLWLFWCPQNKRNYPLAEYTISTAKTVCHSDCSPQASRSVALYSSRATVMITPVYRAPFKNQSFRLRVVSSELHCNV